MSNLFDRFATKPVLAAVVYIGLFSTLAVVSLRLSGFPLDDSYIHQVVARNVVNRHVLGFDPARPSSGSSSLLWTGVLALGQWLFPFHVVGYALAVSAITLAAIGASLAAVALSDGIKGVPFWLLVLSPACSGNFLWFGLLGMEHLLFILLSLCTILGWFGRRSPAYVATFGFLLGLTRPEGTVIAIVLLLRRRAARRSMQEFWYAASGSVLAGIATAGINLYNSGHLTPQTMQGRQLLGALPPLLRRLDFLYWLQLRVFDVWTVMNPDIFRYFKHFLALQLAFGVFSFLVWRGILVVRGADRYVTLLIWTATLIGLYFALLPSLGHGGRYQALALMLVLPLLAIGLLDALSFVVRHGIAEVIVATAMIATAVDSQLLWRRLSRGGITQIRDEQQKMGQFLLAKVSSDDILRQRVAAFDIGRIGYELGGNLVDLGGLVDGNYLSAMRLGQTGAYLRQKGVRYLVLPRGSESARSELATMLSLDVQHGVFLDKLISTCVDAASASDVFAATGIAAPCQDLYRIRYASQPSM